jgi:hypothetical protein
MTYNRGQQSQCTNYVNQLGTAKERRQADVIRVIRDQCPEIDRCDYDQRRYV